MAIVINYRGTETKVDVLSSRKLGEVNVYTVHFVTDEVNPKDKLDRTNIIDKIIELDKIKCGFINALVRDEVFHYFVGQLVRYIH